MQQETTKTPPYSSVNSTAAERTRLSDFYELTKPRLSFLSVLTAIIGYLAASPARDSFVLATFLAGAAFAAGGAAALNQWLEREADAKMARTRTRPIPAGRMPPARALLFGMFLSGTGCGLLYFGTHPLAGMLAAATVASYVLLYTPLKSITPWNTVIGALPGALPPLIGWAAAEGEITLLGWLLFAILFFWQLPHFFAIAWTYRHDYEQGGFKMLACKDADGKEVATHAFGYCLALVCASLLPVLFGYAEWLYGSVALALGAYMLRPAYAFLRADQRNAPARRLFFASLFYLPALLITLLLDLWF
ncbi:MAG: heme o synthase [Opitutales bacterium]